MGRIYMILIALLVAMAIPLVLASSAEARDGLSAGWGINYGGYPGFFPGGGWDNNWYQGWWPQDNWWSRPGWGNWYPGTGGGWGGWFSNCYTRCMNSGYGSTYCSQICPV